MGATLPCDIIVDTVYWFTSIQAYFDPIKLLTQLSEIWILHHRNTYAFLILAKWTDYVTSPF